MKSKYKVGDKVRVRKDLEMGEEYGRDSFAIGMEQFLGQIVTIKKIDTMDPTKYSIEEYSMNWTDEMLENKNIDWQKELE